MDFIINSAISPMSEEQFEEIYDILSSSLPQSEMRKKESQKALLQNASYKILSAYESSEIIGFMAIWDLDSFDFIEHFAVKKYFRGNGLGGKIIDHFLKNCKKPVILEVEPPESTPEAERRIEFYKRHGFNFNPYEYFQPPLQDEYPLIPLKIMSYPTALKHDEFCEVKNILYTNIYGFFEKTLD